MNILRAIILFAFLFIHCFKLLSLPPELKFRNLSTNDGLSHNIVTAILKDYKGFLWVGTNGSLNKYNGYKFTVYEHVYNDSLSLSNNIIQCIFEDRDKQLWVGTLDGLCLYNRLHDNFTRFYRNNNKGSISQNQISTIYQDKSGNLWIGTTGGGLNLYDPKTKTFRYFRHNQNDPNSLSHDIVTSLAEDSGGNLWVGTLFGLNLMVDKDKGKFISYTSSGNPVFKYQNAISQLKKDKLGNIWLGTRDNGLFLLKNTNNNYSLEHITTSLDKKLDLSKLNILSIFINDDNNLWIGTENSGLFLYTPRTGEAANYLNQPDDEQSLSNNSIWYIYKSYDQIIWLSSYNKGLDYIDPNYSRFQGFRASKINKGLGSNNITGFAEDLNGNLWIATDGDGVNYWDRKSNLFKSYSKTNGKLSANEVMCVLADSKGGIWCGTWVGGLNYITPNGQINKFKQSYDYGYLHGNSVVSLSEDAKGRIWIGSVGSGVYYYNRTSQKIIQVLANNENLRYTNIWGQLHAKDGSIWLCSSSGLFMLKETSPNNFWVKQFQHDAKNAESLSDNQTRCAYQDKKNTIWIGTDGGGLNKFDPITESFTRIYKSDGIPDNTIKSITEDDLGNLWLATNKGLCKYNPEKKTIENFDSKDGLFSDLISLNAMLVTKQGEIFIGSYNGVNYFDPLKIKKNPNIPPIYIVDLKVNNEPVIAGKNSTLDHAVTETKKFVLNHRQNVFTLEFAALNYSHPEKNQYTYKLEGFDEKWNYAGNIHSATYTNLKPGTYTFKVKGSNNHGLWAQSPASIEIEILPPFWKSKVAIVLYFASILGMLYLFISFRIARSREKDRIKLERLRIEHEEELYKNKLRFLTNISHELRTPLSLMISPLEQIISNESFSDAAKSKLRLVYRNTQRLYRLIEELMDFSKIENQKMELNPVNSNIVQYLSNIKEYFNDLAAERKIQFTFRYDNDPVFLSFDKEKLDKVFFNLIINAFKYSHDGASINIKLSSFKKETPEWNKRIETIPEFKHNQKSFIVVSVNDTGIGIPQNQLDKIFESFYQVHDERIDSTGTGIGLALAKSIVELHGGYINLLSKEGEGSSFNVYLPIEQINIAKSTTVDNVKRNIIPNIDDFGYKLAETEDKDNLDEDTIPKRYTILLVEDNNELRKYLKTELAKEFKVLEAKSGNAGYELLLKKLPDLVLSDIIMPDGDGLELCSKIKHNNNLNHIPVVLLTAKNTQGDKLTGIETGADAYITKPFNIGILQAQINQILSNRKLIISKLSSSQHINYNTTTTSVEQQFMESLKIIILDKISAPDLSVESIASDLNLSRSQIYRKVKSITDLAPNDYIKNIRMETAKNILETQAVTIVEVSQQVGFSSPSYFTKCFKDTFGVLPLDVIHQKRTDLKQ